MSLPILKRRLRPFSPIWDEPGVQVALTAPTLKVVESQRHYSDRVQRAIVLEIQQEGVKVTAEIGDIRELVQDLIEADAWRAGR